LTNNYVTVIFKLYTIFKICTVFVDLQLLCLDYWLV